MIRVIPVFFILIACGTYSKINIANEYLLQEMKLYTESINNHDYHELYKFLPQKCTEEQTLESFVSEMQSLDTLKYLPKYSLDTLFKIDTIFYDEDNYYARISIGFTTFHDYSEFKSEHGAGFAMSYGILELENQFGKENVKFDKESWIAECHMNVKFFAHSKSGKDWSIFGLAPCSEEYVPNSIRE